nr:unnamed protein product [Spirometra erinaceieuropaei]
MQVLCWLVLLLQAISISGRKKDSKISGAIWFPYVRSRSALAIWNKPLSPTGNIKEYQILAKDIKTNESLEFKSVKDYALLYILKPKTTYQITVIAKSQESNHVGNAISGDVTTLELGNQYDVHVEAETIGPDSIRVTWKPPKDFTIHDIRAYSLYIWESSVVPKDLEKLNAAHYAEPDTTTYTFQSLSPSTSYTVLVKLVPTNTSRLSEFGLASTTTSATDSKISGAIWFPYVRSRSALAIWNKPLSPTGNIKEYQILAKDIKTNESLEFKSVKDYALLYILKPKTTYQITVIAKSQESNHVGNAISGDVTTLELGNQYDVHVEAETIGPDSIRVTWKPPKDFTIHDIRAYSLYIWESSVVPKDLEKLNAAQYSEPDTTTYTFQSLSPSTSYTVLVKLVPTNTSRLSEFGLASTTTSATDSKISGAIWFPYVRSRSVLAIWNKPLSPTGNIKEYQIVAKDIKTNESLEFKSLKNYALLYILKPRTTYQITVIAKSQESNHVVNAISGDVTTLELGNQYDVHVEAETIGPDSIRVTWKPPKDFTTHDIRAYSLYIWESSVVPKDLEKLKVAHYAEPDTTTYTFQSLSPSTSYTVLVKLVPTNTSRLSEFGLASTTTSATARPACGIQELTPSAWSPRQTSRREATPHSWPWTVGLYASVRGGYPYCGGTLVAPDWVITAAHCVEMAMKCIPVPVGRPFSYKALTNATLFARMGDHNLARTEASERDRIVQNIITHPQYRSGSSENDIALLQLERPVLADTAVGFICLPDSDSIVNTSKACAYAGWGSGSRSRIFGYQNAPVLMEGSVTIKSKDFCKKSAQGPKSEGQACLATQTGNPCWGDSGAGVYCNGGEGAWFLYGVLNRGDFLCGGPFATSTNIFPHLEWITKIVTPNPVY